MCNLYRLVISHVGPPTYDLETFHEEQTLEARADLKFHYVAKSDNEIASANCPKKLQIEVTESVERISDKLKPLS